MLVYFLKQNTKFCNETLQPIFNKKLIKFKKKSPRKKKKFIFNILLQTMYAYLNFIIAKKHRSANKMVDQFWSLDRNGNDTQTLFDFVIYYQLKQ